MPRKGDEATTINDIQTDEAHASVKAALHENPTYAEAYNNLGVLYRDEGNIEEALLCYEKCLELNPVSRNASQNRLLAMNCIQGVGSCLHTMILQT